MVGKIFTIRGRQLVSNNISLRQWLRLATQARVVHNATKVALIVGSILALINHGPSIMSLSLESTAILQIAATYLVPYSVATYSAVKMIQLSEIKQKD